MKISILTLFPNMFEGFINESIILFSKIKHIFSTSTIPPIKGHFPRFWIPGLTILFAAKSSNFAASSPY